MIDICIHSIIVPKVVPHSSSVGKAPLPSADDNPDDYIAEEVKSFFPYFQGIIADKVRYVCYTIYLFYYTSVMHHVHTPIHSVLYSHSFCTVLKLHLMYMCTHWV